MICNKILLEKTWAVFRISIELYLNVRKTGSKKIRFQLALNKTYSLTPPPLIHRRLKHRQRIKINKTMPSGSSVFHAKFTISVLKSTPVIELGLPTGCWSPQLGLNSLCHHWFWTQISENENRKLATHRIQSRTHNHNTLFNH